jgi:PAS domain S-box-containing protein
MGRIWKTVQQSMSALVLTVVATTAIATFTSWRLAKLNEREHIHKVTRLAASAVEADLRSDMEAWMLGQIRLAKMWEFGEPTYSQWSAFAGLYLEHHPGCVAIVWLDPKYQERWVSRTPGERVPLPGDGPTLILLQRARDSHQAILSKLLTSPAGKKQWLTVVPIYQKSRFRGYVLGYFEVQRSLEIMLDDIKGLNFAVAIREDGVLGFKLPLSNPENEKRWAQSVDVSFPNAKWQLEVWPRPEAMRDMQSNLPGMTLLFGLSAGLLLVAVARFHKSLRASQARFAGILEISAEAVVSTDEKQNITLFNRAAETIFGYTADEALGKSLDLLIPERFHAIHHAHVDRFVKSDKNSLLMSDRRRVFGRRKDGSEFHMAASISKLEIGGLRTLTVICSDVTNEVRAEDELRQARDGLELRVRERTAELETSNQNLRAEIAERKRVEEEVQDLSRRMLRVQEEERRNLARELHDGATQNLVALALNIARMRKAEAGWPTPDTTLAEWMQMVENCVNELRTVSYLLHPPLLEELGLSLTLRGFVEGFSKRSGVAVTMSTSGELDKLSFDVELAAFRILQEGLANILRHSQSSTATVAVSCDGHTFTLEIADQGRGIPAGSAEGVGLASMRERVRLLKGELEIKTGPAGTTIIVRLPLSAMASSKSTAA